MAYTSEKDLNVFLENKFEILNTKLKSWYRTLMAQDAIIIAIARKAPRLLSYCELKFPDLYNPNVKVISDIAIPFVDWGKTDKKCIVVDEAIYHGTTFEKVLEVAKRSIKDDNSDISGLPLVITQDALSAPNIVDSLKEGWSLIDTDKCNFFIDSIITKFFDLGKPYDIEYPLFYINLPKEKYTKDKIDKNIEFVLMQLAVYDEEKYKTRPVFFKNTNYRREDGQVFSAYTLCTDYVYRNSHDAIMPDFSKLRIFHTNNSVCIASMAPHTINSRVLEPNNSLFNGILDDIWNLLLESSTNIDIKDKIVRHQLNKSLVILANYLLSVNHFMHFKRKLERLFAAAFGFDVELYLKSEDIQWLVGTEMADKIQKMLSTINEFEAIYTPFTNSDTVDSVIPASYKKDFLMQLTLDNMFDNKTVGSIISNVFCDLHWMVEVKSRRQSRDTYNRLEFGESLSSISDLCASLLTEGYSIQNVHKNIDMRIDRGSMVPDYVYVNDAFNSYWKRMFRSGENEDLTRDQHFRICVNVLNLYLSKIKSTSISADELKLLFALLAKIENIFNKGTNAYNSVFATQMKVVFEKGEYKILVWENDEGTDLLEKLERYHVISETEKYNYDVTSSVFANLLSNGLPLSEKQRNKILRIVDFVVYAHRNIDEAIISELKNYACFSEDSVDKSFCIWKSNVEKFIEDDIKISFNSLNEAFADLYLSVPEPQLEVSDNLFASSEVGTWMKEQITSDNIHRFSQTMVDKLHATFYIVNLWNKYNGASPSTYYNPSMFDSFRTLVSCFRHIEGDANMVEMLSTCGPKLSIDRLSPERDYIQTTLKSLLSVIK